MSPKLILIVLSVYVKSTYMEFSQNLLLDIFP